MKKTLSCLTITFSFILSINAQSTFSAAGATGSSSYGSVSFTVGQIDYLDIGNSTGVVSQGVQQGVEYNASLRAKVFLTHVDPNTGLMDDYIKSMMNFPLSDPYAAAGAYNGKYTHVRNSVPANTSASVLAAFGNNSIVDWVFLELRSGSALSTSVENTKSALLQRDGDIVAMDGVSPVRFYMPDGNYYLAVRHRNHLGFRTSQPIALSSTPALVDFTNNSVALDGSFPLTEVINNPNLFSMVGGDDNADGSIDAFDPIVFNTYNGLFDDYTLNSDLNLDGSVDAFDTIIWETHNGKFEELN